MASSDKETYDVKGGESEHITPETTNDSESGINLEYEKKLMSVLI